MKLRLRDSAVRLRLTRSEVDSIGRGESVGAVTRFPDGSVFRYRLAVDAHGSISACFVDGCLQVVIPHGDADAWAAGSDVAIEARLPMPDGECHVLIEKDFACLHPRAEDDGAETFPNPTASRDRS